MAMRFMNGLGLGLSLSGDGTLCKDDSRLAKALCMGQCVSKGVYVYVYTILMQHIDI